MTATIFCFTFSNLWSHHCEGFAKNSRQRSLITFLRSAGTKKEREKERVGKKTIHTPNHHRLHGHTSSAHKKIWSRSANEQTRIITRWKRERERESLLLPLPPWRFSALLVSIHCAVGSAARGCKSCCAWCSSTDGGAHKRRRSLEATAFSPHAALLLCCCCGCCRSYGQLHLTGIKYDSLATEHIPPPSETSATRETRTLFYSSSDQEMIKETMTIDMSTDQIHTRVHTQSPLQLSLVMNCIAVVALFFFFFFSVIASLPSIPKGESVALKAIWQHHSHLAPRIALSWRELAPRIAASLTKISFKNLQFLTLLCFLNDRLLQDKLPFSWRAHRSFLLPTTNIPSEVQRWDHYLIMKSFTLVLERERERENSTRFWFFPYAAARSLLSSFINLA